MKIARSKVCFSGSWCFVIPFPLEKKHLSLFLYLAENLPSLLYKHYAIDIANPSSMQDVCYMNFVIDLAHRGVSLAQW